MPTLPQGIRIAQRHYDTHGGEVPAWERRYLYEGMQVIAELDGVGAVVKAFYWGHDISDSPGGAWSRR